MNFYSQNAPSLADLYNSVPFGTVHASWLHLMPPQDSHVLDVGAGSGRDAKWFAVHRRQVVAVEPCAELRTLGTQYAATNVRWLDDSLPKLTQVQRLNLRFDLILLSAVWMHIPPADRSVALKTLSQLLRPGGILVIIVRETPFDDGRPFYPNKPEKLRAAAKKFQLEPILEAPSTDHLGRPEIAWRTSVFRLESNLKPIPILPERLDWPSLIGNFILNFGYLEYLTFAFLKGRLPAAEFEQLRDQHLKDRTLYIQNLLEQKKTGAKLQASFAKLAKQIESLRLIRNHIAHGHPYVDIEAKEPTLVILQAKDIGTGHLPATNRLKFSELLAASTLLIKVTERFKTFAGFGPSEAFTVGVPHKTLH